MRTALATAVLCAAMIVGPAAPASAEEFRCARTVGARTLDNVRVPDGRTCKLEGSVVKGTINVGTGATLIADGARVAGNVQAESARRVVVRDGRVGGSMQIVQGRRAALRRNRVDGNLQCKENSPRPTGGGNVVEGSKEDQCRRL